MFAQEYVKELVKTHEPGLYETKNDKLERVAVCIDGEHGAVFRIYQSNGWTRVEEYDKDGNLELDTFDGRWDRD